MRMGDPLAIMHIVCGACRLCCSLIDCFCECSKRCRRNHENRRNDELNNDANTSSTVPNTSNNVITIPPTTYISSAPQQQNSTGVKPQPTSPSGYGASQAVDLPPSYLEATKSNLTDPSIKTVTR